MESNKESKGTFYKLSETTVRQATQNSGGSSSIRMKLTFLQGGLGREQNLFGHENLSPFVFKKKEKKRKKSVMILYSVPHTFSISNLIYISTETFFCSSPKKFYI